MEMWTKEEEKILIEIYDNKKNEEISEIIGKTKSSIVNKANSLGLKKSKTHRSKMISLRNKKVNRDLNYEFIKKIAMNYKSRSEFQYNDASAYTTARVNGYLDEVCLHMTNLSFSIPQMMLYEICKKFISNNIRYNDRKTIRPYEIDIFLPDLNLAFEYDGKGWHQNNKNDEVKGKILSRKKIFLIKFVENNRKYEIDIKNQFIKIIDYLNNKYLLKIDEQEVRNFDLSFVYSKILNEDNIRETCLSYSSFTEFRKNEKRIYHYLIKSNKMTEYTSHMKKRGGITEDSAKKEVEKYTHICDLIKYSYRFYIWIKKHKKDYLLDGLIRKKTLQKLIT